MKIEFTVRELEFAAGRLRERNRINALHQKYGNTRLIQTAGLTYGKIHLQTYCKKCGRLIPELKGL